MVIAAGDNFPLTLARRWQDLAGPDGTRVATEYGPTEITIGNSGCPVDTTLTLEAVPLGAPFPNTGMYVLTEDLQPVPVGVAGEVYIDGTGVSRGYHGRPDLTAEKYLPNPHGPAGTRLYRTGDLARFLPDGTLETLGRIDNQVKIRGYRIELGEIEARLREHPQITDTVVTVRENQAGEKALIGYLVAGTAVDTAALRAELAEKLPEYMVPAAFVAIDAIPLTANGKVDTRALPAPDLEAFTASRYTAPRTPLEERLAAIWAEVLGLPQVGVEDSFFDLGGDSIRAVRLVGAMRAAGHDVSIRDVFQQRTIAAMATTLPGNSTGESLITAVRPFELIGEDDRKALPAGVVDAYPLSQIQTGMLVEMLAADGGNSYHNINSFRLPDPKPFEAAAMREAIAIVAGRHEVLRTSVDLAGYSRPLQLVHATVEIPFVVEDLRGMSAAEQDAHGRAFVAAARTSGFDLVNGPLLHLAVHIESDEAWRLTVSHLHAVTDGWTINSFLMELVGCYQALRDGREPAAYEVPAVRYADYVAAEEAALASTEEQAFWQDVVDAHTPLRIPATWAGAEDSESRHSVRVPFADLDEGLRRLAAGARTSLKSVLLSAHLKVMGSLTAETDFHTGVVYHGRLEAPGADRVLGMHLNTLPFPATRGARTWRELVERTYATETAIWSHRRYPLPAVQRAAGNARDLLTVLFDHQDFHQVDTGTVDTGGALDDGRNEFGLMAIAGVGQISLGAAASTMSRENLERLGAMYRLVLEAMAADADGDALAVPLAEADRRLVPVRRAPAERQAGQPGELSEELSDEQWETRCLHELFTAQAVRTPDAVALTSGDLSLTYAELDERANRIAHHLIALGAGPDRVIGLSLERGPDLVPALLGILKSGAAYLPLDPANPADRLAYMLADAGSPILVTHSALEPVEFAGTRVLVDADRAEIAARPATAPVTGVRPDNLAYVIYTSGSTGLPKGVSSAHTHVTRLFTATRADFPFAADDVWALFHSYAFDFSVKEIWAPLLHGGRLVVVPAMVARSPQELVELLVAERVTVLCQTPSAFRSLTGPVQEGDPRVDRLALRAVVFGGERLDMSQLAAWTAKFGVDSPALINIYGPTETTVHSIYHRVTEADLPRTASPIGLPVADTVIHLLDAHGHRVPDGVPGEIHVGGPGVARGYLNRPGLTAERFVPDPYGPAGSRLYRTGDLAWRLPDGRYESLGRIDGQVKVRGFRIELGEIEARLREHPLVDEAAVIVHRNEAGEKSLVAYLVPAGSDAPDLAAVRSDLAAVLPGYMVPAAFVTLERIPLTTNGKVNRRALPAPEQAVSVVGEHHVEPRTEREAALAAVWAEVLGLPRVGVEESFFDLGGDSIRAVRLVGAMREAGHDVTIRDVFEQRTIAALAAALPGGDGRSLVTAVEPFALIGAEDRAALPAGVVDAYPLSQIQTGMLVELMAGEGAAAYHHINSFRIPDTRPFAERALRQALELLADRHELLRTSVHLTGFGRPLQLVHAAAEVPLTVHDVRGLTEDERAERARGYVAEERARGFELTAAPLLRIAVHVESDEAWRVTASHIHAVTDGWTLNSLLMELLDTYRTLRDGGEPAAHEAPAVRYADYVAAELAALSDPADQAFWQDVVDRHSPLELPATWRDRGAGSQLLDVEYADLEEGLRALATGANTSLKTVLLAAHLTVMGSLSTSPAFHTGVVYHGRLEAPGAERVLGMHLNTLPFPAVRGTGTWRELVERTYATETELWSHRRYPLPAIQRAAGQGRAALSVMFEFLDFHQVDRAAVDVRASMNDGSNEFALTVIATGGRIGLTTGAGALGRAQLERLVAMYRLVLESMAADPDGDATAGHLPAPTAPAAVAEVEQPLLVGLIAEQAARTPKAVAVVADGRRLSYREVDERANRIAHHLTALAVGPGAVVGVALARGAELVPVLQGVWRAGAAYLLIDPAAEAGPVDPRVTFLITDRAVAGGFTGGVLRLDAEAAGIAARPSGALPVAVPPEGVACLLDGEPVDHRELSRLLEKVRAELGGIRRGAWLAAAPGAGVAAAAELHLPLTGGARVVLASEAQAAEPAALVALVDAQRVTHVQATPEGWRGLLAAGFDSHTVTALVAGGAGPDAEDVLDELRARAQRVVAGVR
ncbi:amino acid adenylation domain-containing protein [Kitasatospora sp. NPDC004240]